MSRSLLMSMSEGLRARRASGQDKPSAPKKAADPTIARAPDGAPYWFIPASAIAERLEQLHPRHGA